MKHSLKINFLKGFSDSILVPTTLCHGAGSSNAGPLCSAKWENCLFVTEPNVAGENYRPAGRQRKCLLVKMRRELVQRFLIPQQWSLYQVATKHSPLATLKFFSPDSPWKYAISFVVQQLLYFLFVFFTDKHTKRAYRNLHAIITSRNVFVSKISC